MEEMPDILNISIQCLMPSNLHGVHIQCVSRSSDNFKVVLEDGDGATQGFMTTPTEQGHTHVE